MCKFSVYQKKKKVFVGDIILVKRAIDVFLKIIHLHDNVS